MSYDKSNIKAWSKQIAKNQMLYPNERVIACLAKNFKEIKENNRKNGLDIGFGSGRHLKLLLDYGFNTYGIDYSDKSVEIAKDILSDYKDRIKIKKADLRDKIYADNFFDFIICFGVIFLREQKEIAKDLKIINSLLKKNGKMIINFRTKEDYNYKKGKQVSENTYLLDHRTGPYENMLYTFLDLDEAVKMLTDSGFTVENKERVDFWKNNLQEHHSWWIFSVRR
ncbi:methyltransferase domain-containing protein [Clostridiaceae bacterium M8S5]|nr:methyltransferase domain-containing protein [Clostridiaceae bacterium M8S5]